MRRHLALSLFIVLVLAVSACILVAVFLSFQESFAKDPPKAKADPKKKTVAIISGERVYREVICSGGTIGSSNYYRLSGAAAQISAGGGSSPSYGLGSGFWEGHLKAYLRGDSNADGAVSIADLVFLINYLFKWGAWPDPLWVGDVNCDKRVTIADAVYLINYLFKFGPAPC